MLRIAFLMSLALAALAGFSADDEEEFFQRTLRLEPRPGVTRNSEGSFLRLRDGRVIFIYSCFTGGAHDDSKAHLAQRVSTDGGKTWTADDTVVLKSDAAMNLMSVTLLRIDQNTLAMFYLHRKTDVDMRPCVRFSTDEAKTWGDEVPIIPDSEIGYYVLNNDRVIQLKNGRLVLPVALHRVPDTKWNDCATILCYFSDDKGHTWKRGQPAAKPAEPRNLQLQEPGVVELKDGSVLLFCRTNAGSQYVSTSADGGATWVPLGPSTMLSPLSPASIKRIPGKDELLLAWNNHDGIAPALKGKRTPLNTAISKDEGKTWTHINTFENNPAGWYCYTAIYFVDQHVLLAYCAGDTSQKNYLNTTQLLRIPVGSLYGGK